MALESALSKNMHGGVRVRTPGKYIILSLFLPVMLVALGAGIWLDVVSKRSALAALEYRKSESGIETAYFTLPEFLVDLSPDLNGRTTYLKMRASIVLNEEDVKEIAMTIDAVRPAVLERLTFFMRELRPEDFQGSEGMARVKREMVRRINIVIAPERIGDVVIEEIVIQ